MKQIIFLKSRMHKQGGLEKYLDRLSRYFMKQGASVSVLTSSQESDFSHVPYPVYSVSSPCSLSWLHILLFDRKVKQALFQKPSEDGWLPKLMTSIKRKVRGLFNRAVPPSRSMALFDHRATCSPCKSQKAVLFGFDRHFIELTHYRAGNGCHRAYLEKRGRACGRIKRISLWLNPLHWVILLSEKKTLECPKTITICNSHMVKKEFLRWYPKAEASRISVIHNGVEWGEYEEHFRKREEERLLFCRNKNIDTSLPHILFVGNEWERKGVRVLLQALARIAIPFRCTIVGKEKRWQRFQRLAHRLKIEKSVFFYPNHESVLPWYQRADILVLPSLYDPFANVTVEALAMGLWVVTSSSNGGGEVIQEGLTGSVVTSFDQMAWKRALESALVRVQREPHLKERIREEARQFDFALTLRAYGDLIMR